MNAIDATETELRDIAETLKLAAILDDRAPAADRARIVAWAEQIHRHRLTRTDLLDGLQAFYDAPSERCIQLGDLVHHARNAKRTRTEREADDVRDDRRQGHDAKAVDVLAQMPMGPTANRTERLVKAENALQVCTNRAEAMQAIGEYFDAKRGAATQTATGDLK